MGLVGPSAATPLVLIVALVAAGAVQWLALRHGGRPRRRAGRRSIAGLVDFVAASAAFVLVVVPGRVVSSLFRQGPLRRTEGAWVPLRNDSGVMDVRSSWIQPSRTVRGVGHHRRAWVFLAVLAALTVALVGTNRVAARREDPAGIGGVVAAVARSSSSPSSENAELGRLFPGEPWWAEVVDPPPTGPDPDPELVWSLDDVESAYVNVRDRRRWTTTVDDAALEVWFFGGSAAFGLGQRDTGTIASQLVDVARRAGVRLEVVNFGVPGYVNSQETALFEAELQRRPAPDIAVFYDGVNEIGVANEREMFGLLDPQEDVVMAATESLRRERERQVAATGFEPHPDLDRMVNLAATQYDRNVRRARTAAAAAGVTVFDFWQPWLGTIRTDRPGVRFMMDRYEIEASDLAGARALTEQVLRASTTGPIDLTHTLDEVTFPTLYDWAHTNEAGAGVQAAAIFRHLRPALEAERAVDGG